MFCDCCNSTEEQFNKSDTVTAQLDGHTLPAEWNYLTTFECPQGAGAFSTYGAGVSEYYCAMRWDYSQPGGKEWWYQKKILIEANNKAIVTSIEDWGPAQEVIDKAIEKCGDGERSIIDVSSPVAQYLFGVSSSGWGECRRVRVSFADQSLPLGPSGACHDFTDTTDTSGNWRTWMGVMNTGDTSTTECLDVYNLIGWKPCLF